MDGGAWWAAVHGVANSQTRLSDFTCTFHFHAFGEGNGKRPDSPGEPGMQPRDPCLPWSVPAVLGPILLRNHWEQPILEGRIWSLLETESPNVRASTSREYSVTEKMELYG